MSARTLSALRPAVLEWHAFGEPGLSSKAIAEHLTGVPIAKGRRDYPHDPGDFRRCEVLLRHIPILRLTFHEMTTASPQWAALVPRWDEIADLIESEVPGIFDGSAPFGATAPRAYALMKEIVKTSYAKEQL